jgi:ectoine hydroxylase-related dioxygenase (phytanoyl-CoA dioxygenase family)
LITDSDVAAYDRDGVACLRRAFDPYWVERMRAAVERGLASPGPYATNFAEGSTAGRFFGDMYMWQHDPDFRAAALGSPAAAIAAQMMGSASSDFFYDQLFVKEPGTAHPTPWHQDQLYWPVKGWQITSVWIALDDIDRSNGAVEFVAGSLAGASATGPRPFARVTRSSSPRATLSRFPTSTPIAQNTTSGAGSWHRATAWCSTP